MGQETTALGGISTAMGWETIALGEVSTAMGFNTIASGNMATAMGYGTTASGHYSTAIGMYVTAGANAAIVLGRGVSDSAPLVNNIDSSLAIGFNDTTATLFVGTDHRVGVGLTDPAVTLDVSDMIRIQGRNYPDYPDSGAGLEIAYWPPGNTGIIQAYSRETSSFGNLYLGNGNVGIGTESPTQKLHVMGDIYCTGKLTSDGGNDPPYVLYNKESRAAIVDRVAAEVPEEKQDGAVLFWNGEDKRFEVYLPDDGEFRDLDGNLLDTVKQI
jgi:hypothetical protein